MGLGSGLDAVMANFNCQIKKHLGASMRDRFQCESFSREN